MTNPGSSIAKDSTIYVAGHRGLVGSAIVRRLEAEGYRNLILRSSNEVYLRDGLMSTYQWYNEHEIKNPNADPHLSVR